MIVDQNIITVEAFVHLSRKYVNYEYFGSKENFIFVVKWNNERIDDVLIELEPIDSPKFNWIPNKKLIFNLDLKLLKKDNKEKRDRDLVFKIIFVAVIWNHDYNKLLKNATVVKDSRILLPYSFSSSKLCCAG